MSSAELLARGPLVISFYRGRLCPYCNTELQALEQARPALQERGARLVAISPQSQANSRKSQPENGKSYTDSAREICVTTLQMPPSSARFVWLSPGDARICEPAKPDQACRVVQGLYRANCQGDERWVEMGQVL